MLCFRCFRCVFFEIIKGSRGHKTRVVVAFKGGHLAFNFLFLGLVVMFVGVSEGIERSFGHFFFNYRFGLALGHILGYDGNQLFDRMKIYGNKNSGQSTDSAKAPRASAYFITKALI